MACGTGEGSKFRRCLECAICGLKFIPIGGLEDYTPGDRAYSSFPLHPPARLVLINERLEDIRKDTYLPAESPAYILELCLP